MNFKPAITINFNPDIAYLIGVIQGDGHVGKVLDKNGWLSSLSVVISVGHKDKPYIKILKKIIKNQFNYDAKIYNDSSCFRVGIYNRSLVRALEDFKRNMKVPNFFLAKNEMLAAYLQGLFDTDGSCTISSNSISGTIDFATNRIGFAYEIRDILEKSFNIYSNIRISRKGDYKPVYRVAITNKSNITKFVGSIGFRHPRKIKVSNNLIKHYVKIKERSMRNRGHEKIINELVQNKELSTNDIASKLNLHRETVKEHLENLENKKIVKKRVVYFNRWGIIDKPSCKRHYWRLTNGA